MTTARPVILGLPCLQKLVVRAFFLDGEDQGKTCGTTLSLQALNSLVLVGLGLFGSLILAIAREERTYLKSILP